MRRLRIKLLKALRILSQAVFLTSFTAIILVSLDPFSHVDNVFLRADPLIFLTHPVVQPLYFGIMMGLVLLALAAGRIFCGWICPLGAVIDLLDFLLSPLRRLLPRFRIGKAWIRTPPSLFLLWALVPAAFLAPPIVQFTHPNIWLVRIMTLTTAGVVFLGVLVLFSLVRRRFWCTLLCPLGALYGLLGRISLFRLRITVCSSCGRCSSCPMGAAEDQSREILPGQCILCFSFESRCPMEGFSWRTRMKPAEPGRRLFLRHAALFAGGTAVAGLLALPERRLSTQLLRPPGVTEEAVFIERCLRCLQCVRSCPNGIIRPAGIEAGLGSLLTPRIDFKQYGCDYYCQVCQLVCPNRAIPLQDLAVKQRTPIGCAEIDTDHCVVYRDGINCIVCEEFCPVPEKAVELHEEVVAAGGEVRILRKPTVAKDRCIGCGICQANCPVSPPAITVKKQSLSTLFFSSISGLFGS